MRIIILVVCLWLATSPLYAKIVFSSHRDDARYEIFTIDIDGGEAIQIWWRFTPSVLARTVGRYSLSGLATVAGIAASAPAFR